MTLGEPPQALRNFWAAQAQREIDREAALISLPGLVAQLTELLHGELSARRKNEQTDELLQRAAELISAAWNGPTVYMKGVPWETVAGRWLSDYERRDEWIIEDDNH